MAQIAPILAVVLALARPVFSLPQTDITLYCQYPGSEFRIEDVSNPYYVDAESVGGKSCPAGETGDCEHQTTFQHSVGVTQSVGGEASGGLDLGKLLNLGIAAGFEYS